MRMVISQGEGKLSLKSDFMPHPTPTGKMKKQDKKLKTVKQSFELFK